MCIYIHTCMHIQKYVYTYIHMLPPHRSMDLGRKRLKVFSNNLIQHAISMTIHCTGCYCELVPNSRLKLILSAAGVVTRLPLPPTNKKTCHPSSHTAAFRHSILMSMLHPVHLSSAFGNEAYSVYSGLFKG